MKKVKNTGKSIVASSKSVIKQSITDYGVRAMKLYAAEVNLDRAVPDLMDGLKPVHRRILWALSQLPRSAVVKSARVVGETMGKYHAHGDSSIYGGMVTMVQACTPLIYGSGNWGTLVDGAAAMRYTEAKLTSFGASAFDPDYANKEVTSFVPNYDDKDVEPITLPFPLPVILFNGGSGIGYGTASSLPSFTPESVVDVCKQLLGGEKLQPLDFAKALKPVQKWGGSLVKSKANRQAWNTMFTTNKASVQFESNLIVDASKRSVVINEWPDGLNPLKFVEKVRALKETQEVYTSKGSAEFTIIMRKGYNSVQFDEYVSRIQKMTHVKSSYNICVTQRTATDTDGVIDYDVKILNPSIPQLLVLWLRSRIETEIKSLNYRVRKQEAAIAYSELLIYASTKLEIIFKALRTDQAATFMVKHLKITVEQANQILDLQVRKLSKLDQDALKAKLKTQQGELKTLNGYLKAPKRKIAADMDNAMALIVADREYSKKVNSQKLTFG